MRPEPPPPNRLSPVPFSFPFLRCMKYRAILLFGAPGAGKGTQGKILGQIPNFVHFSCGDAFRNLRVDSSLGRVFMEYASKGQLVPDEPTIELWQRTCLGRSGRWTRTRAGS